MAYYRIDDVLALDGFTYVEVSIWDNRGAFQRGDAPAEVQDFVMQLSGVGAVQNVKRKRGNNYVKVDDTEWTESEYAAEVAAYHRLERAHPRLELALDSVAVDHAAQIVANIERYLDFQKNKGRAWRGDMRDKRIQKRAARVDEVADLPDVKALKLREAERP